MNLDFFRDESGNLHLVCRETGEAVQNCIIRTVTNRTQTREVRAFGSPSIIVTAGSAECDVQLAMRDFRISSGAESGGSSNGELGWRMPTIPDAVLQTMRVGALMDGLPGHQGPVGAAGPDEAFRPDVTAVGPDHVQLADLVPETFSREDSEAAAKELDEYLHLPLLPGTILPSHPNLDLLSWSRAILGMPDVVENANRIAAFIWDVHVRGCSGGKPRWLKAMTDLLKRYSPALCYLVVRKIEVDQRARLEKLIEFHEKAMAAPPVNAATPPFDGDVMEDERLALPLKIYDESPVT